MGYVLIIFIAFHFDGGITETTISFETKQACIAAQQQVNTKWSLRRQSWGRKQIFTVCVAK